MNAFNNFYQINNVKNIVLYTFSDLKEEINKYINLNSIRKILFIDKQEYIKCNDHKIYIYATSIYEKNEKLKKIRFKLLEDYLRQYNIWISDSIDRSLSGPIKILNRKWNENFYINNLKKIEESKLLFKKEAHILYDDIIYSIETGNFFNLQRHKSKYQQYNHPQVKAEKNDIIVDGRCIQFKIIIYVFS